MNIPGKLREDLKRIYGNIDPLNCIEDVVITENMDETLCHVALRVPRGCERYVRSFTLRDVPYGAERWAREQAMMADLLSSPPGAQKAPEKKDTIDFVKPERILFSGPKTIVFWPDGSKTMVSLGEGQEHDEYTAFCSAVVKKLFGATHKAKKFLDKVKVVQEPKVKKPKEDKPWEQMETMPMPGTETPGWGEKHWGARAVAEEGETDEDRELHYRVEIESALENIEV